MLKRVISRFPRTAQTVAALQSRLVTFDGAKGSSVVPAGSFPVTQPLPVQGFETGDAAPIGWRQHGAKLSFVIIVLIPTLAASVYTLLWASNRYQSEFRVAVRTVQPIQTGGLADLFGIGGISQSGNDSNAVVQYLQSREAIQNLERKMPLQKIYSASSIDWFSRLSSNPEIEKFARYWNRMLDATYEASTGTIIVRVAAFDPQDAYRISQQLLADSEELVNRLSTRARDDSVAFAERQVANAEARLTEVRQRAKTLQDKEKTLDPSKSAEMNLALAAKLKEEIARRSAELSTQKLRLAADAPSVMATREAISGLQEELQHIESQATQTVSMGPFAKDEERPLSSILGAFQQNADERTFAEKAYLSALTSLETARMDANRQQVYLSTIVSPGLPQEAAFPRPLKQIPETFLIAGALWLIGRLALFAIKEHM